MCVELTENQESQLLTYSNILRIENDVKVEALGKTTNTSQPNQLVPWGIHKIKADTIPSTIIGSGVKVAIIDSGIDLTHPDLKNAIKGGYNAIKLNQTYTDDFGHGTHVAGIVAAANNSIGVVGFSP
ncbi:MAG: S8 family serine peptidase [Clostridiaceae bacterium]